MAWVVQRHRGGADHLHHLDLGTERGVHVMELDAPAVALGSTQSQAVLDPGLLDPGLLGYAVTKRHSGGGLVVMQPGEMTWIDVVIPSSDPLWDDDIARAFHWLGDLWATALGLAYHVGPPESADLGRIVCFAGIGSGEVVDRTSVDRTAAKVVGMSQRRSRTAARFQCMFHHAFDPAQSMAVLAPELRSGPLGQQLAARLAVGVEVVRDPTVVVDRLLELIDAVPSGA